MTPAQHRRHAADRIVANLDTPRPPTHPRNMAPIGLTNILTIIKPLALLCLLGTLFAAPPASAFDHSHSELDSVLKTRVDAEGMVDYAGLKANRSALDGYLAKTGAVGKSAFDAWTRNQQLAFLINVYNAETLKLVIDHYPVKSIKKIGGLLGQPWDVESATLFGKKTTLNTIEHKILRPKYQEPRVHFAIVCAAMGCPPLRNRAFTPENLDEQLDARGRIFLNQGNKNRVEGDTLYLSPIFDWFGEDFTAGGTSLDFVAPFFPVDIKGKKLKVKFTDYDWSLNQQ